MGTTTQKLQAVLSSKEAIRQVINSKGVEVLPTDTLSSYPDKIAAIPTVGVQEGHTIRYFDYDGMIYHTEILQTGEALTYPPSPSHVGLDFAYFNTLTANATTDLDVGAIYRPQSNTSKFYITLTPTTGLSLVFYFTKPTAGLMTVYFGDGSFSTYSYTGTPSFAHTYAAPGDYAVTVEYANQYGVGGGSTAFPFLDSTYNSILTKAFLASNASLTIGGFYRCAGLKNVVFSNGNIADNAFNGCNSLEHINIPPSVLSIESSAFSGCFALKNVCISESVTSIKSSVFANCTNLVDIVIPSSVATLYVGTFGGSYGLKSYIHNYSGDTGFSLGNAYALEKVVLPAGLRTFSGVSGAYSLRNIVLPITVNWLGSSCFNNCYAITELIIPEAVTYIEGYAFSGCRNLKSLRFSNNLTTIGNNAFADQPTVMEYVFLSTTPPTAGASIFNNLNKLTKIYVPDASVAAYKAATNWVTYANYIYPLSQLPA